jgi:hypothetical protein
VKNGWSHPDNLLIIYYSGHGDLDTGRMMWQAYKCVQVRDILDGHLRIYKQTAC